MTIQRVYNSLKRKFNWELCMPNYPEYKWGDYKIRLRPSDRFRKRLADWGLPDFLNYFDDSTIFFDLRIGMHNNKKIHDIIKYEWILCNRNDKPIEDSRFHFYHPIGGGDFEISNENLSKRQSHRGNDVIRYDGAYVKQFKIKAIDIGNLSQLEHYKIVMRFTNSSGSANEFQIMAHFTIIDHDKLWLSIRIALIGVIATAIAGAIIALILRAFGKVT